MKITADGACEIKCKPKNNVDVPMSIQSAYCRHEFDACSQLKARISQDLTYPTSLFDTARWHLVLRQKADLSASPA